jgi:large repetitive protein
VGRTFNLVMIDVLANDIDIDGGPKTIVAVTQPGHGTVAITGGGTGLTFTPNANFNGSDIFTYTLNGGSPATVNVTVGAVDDAPIAVVDTATVPVLHAADFLLI